MLWFIWGSVLIACLTGNVRNHVFFVRLQPIFPSFKALKTFVKFTKHVGQVASIQRTACLEGLSSSRVLTQKKHKGPWHSSKNVCLLSEGPFESGTLLVDHYLDFT